MDCLFLYGSVLGVVQKEEKQGSLRTDVLPV